MISIECDCGRKLKVKDELAGKRVRCPGCSEPVKVPAAEAEDAFLENLDDEMEDESEEELPRPRSSSRKATKKPAAKKARSKSGAGITAKQVFGGIIMALGVLLLGGIVVFVFTGDFQPKRVGGFLFPIVMISMGWAWVKGETYGN